MSLLPELKQGFDAIMANKDNIVWNIGGNMTFFPLCCSTGVLNNLVASIPDEHLRPAFEANESVTLRQSSLTTIKKAKYIHEIIKAVSGASRPVLFPIEVARWNALSLVLVKSVIGTDNGPGGGYNNYKAAQITMCDRLVADKRDKRFKFGGYNIVYSTDQFMDWLGEQNGAFGEFLVSTARPGGHGARVRAAIFTPDHDVLQSYLDERIERVREYVLEYIKPKGVVKQAVDKVAATW